MTTKVYQEIASRLGAIAHLKRTQPDSIWLQNHADRIELIIKEHLPSGSGIDGGVTLDESSTPERLVFYFEFHHMNDAGMYDGWTQHKCIVKPSLAFGIDIRITGRDRNGIKEYLADTFHSALENEVTA